VQIADSKYQPSLEDIVRSRVRTSGVIETDLLIAKNPVKLVDFGGTRNERKKWIRL